mmetsp:Transcript_6615/g.13131  ORF Transcript_6615/g.13131 Transcript_6615/m.13131 type:complete len:239 (-) Transcript_6615:212-928(-)
MPLYPDFIQGVRCRSEESESGHNVRNHLEMHGSAMAAAVADFREEISVHVHAVSGDSRQESFAMYGLPGCQDDLRLQSYRSILGHLRHVRSPQRQRWQCNKRNIHNKNLLLPPTHPHPRLPLRPRHGPPLLPRHLPPLPHLERAHHDRRRRLRIRTNRGIPPNRRRTGGNEIRLGKIRFALSAALFSLRGDGKSVFDVCDAHVTGGRSISGRCGGARDHAQLVGQFGHECELESFLVE